MSIGPLVLAIPTLNSERYLRATLESINAAGTNLHWWLQDGLSADETLSIARELARPGDTIRSEKDHGQAWALNRAFAQMDGEIIGFLNSDDCLAPGVAERVLSCFEENPAVDLIYGKIEWLDSEGRITGTHRGKIGSLEEILDIYNVWWAKRQWVQPEVFFRRSLFERVGPFDTHYELAFDYDFWVRCFRAGAVVWALPDVLARFRLHADQKSTNAERAAREIRQIVRRHIQEQLPISPGFRKNLETSLTYDLYRNREEPFDQPAVPFLKALWNHPRWITLPPVRKRLEVSFHARIGGRLLSSSGNDV